jgi:hypothetical protein
VGDHHQQVSRPKVSKRDNQLKVLELRKMGATYRQIEATLGISFSYARKLAVRAFAELEAKVGESAEELRRLHLERLEDLYATAHKAWRQSNYADSSLLDKLRMILESERRLLGLDAPEKLQVSPGGTDADAMTDEQLAAIARPALIAIKRKPKINASTGNGHEPDPPIEGEAHEVSGEDYARADKPPLVN